MKAVHGEENGAGRLPCRHCGRDWLNLAAHLWWTHGQRAEEYRAEYAIPPGQRLVDQATLRKVSDAAIRNGGAARIRDRTDSRWRSGGGEAGQVLGTIIRSAGRPPGLWATVRRLLDLRRDGGDLEETLDDLERLTASRGREILP